ncbi:hypothetical protein EV356DRAFT_508687 [Viridothelium virens]|uniref:NB-ARC domain-containing protein n=1 Tax=Viridothelium virens TaxID=1048519 RepID=A0A6A6HJR7_VIRVR|nr:hypothetical protein EV356DRAFT_508687 [Viridothelium virens]
MSASSVSSNPIQAVAIPYSQNRDFTGRQGILNRLKHVFEKALHGSEHDSQTRSALYGLGGTGKSQIAIDFAYWILKQSPTTSVFWVHAGNFERFREDYQTIAETCKIPGRNASKANILQVVHDWLKEETHGHWFLIIDNADDEGLFFQSTSPPSSFLPRKTPPLSEYLPECAHGSILFTTRDQITAGYLTQNQNLLKVDKMSEEEAGDLLTKIFKTSYSFDQTSQLARKLEYLPLALVQAASYIQRPGMSLGKYLELLKSDPIALLSRSFPAAGRLTDIPHALASTWSITFKYLRINFYIAWKIFALMSFLDTQAIPKSILKATGKQGLELEEALGHMISFSLIHERAADSTARLRNTSSETSSSDECYDMHPLVRLVTQEWLKSQGRADDLANEMFSLLARSYPFDRQNPSWTTLNCHDLYEPHVVEMLKRAPSRETREARANLLGKRGRMFATSGRAIDSIECLEEVVEILEELSGPEHPDAMRTTFDLIRARGVLKDISIWKDLLSCNRTLKKAIDILPLDSPVIRQGALAMAACFRQLSLFEDGMLLTMFAIDSHRKSVGPDDSSFLALEDIIASDLCILKDEKAEQVLQSLFQKRTQQLGKGHWSTVYIMQTLWLLYHSTDRPSKAEAIARERISLLEERLGHDHLLTLSSRYYLTLACADLGRWTEAAELAESVIPMFVRVRGLRDSMTLCLKQLLCVRELLEGRDTAAIEMQSGLVRLAEQHLGKSSPSTAYFANRLKVWQDESTRAAYKRSWNEGSEERNIILAKQIVVQSGSKQTYLTKSQAKTLSDAWVLVDALLRGGQRSSISIHLWGTQHTIRRNGKRLCQKHADFSPSVVSATRPPLVLAPWCRRLLGLKQNQH